MKVRYAQTICHWSVLECLHQSRLDVELNIDKGAPANFM